MALLFPGNITYFHHYYLDNPKYYDSTIPNRKGACLVERMWLGRDDDDLVTN